MSKTTRFIQVYVNSVEAEKWQNKVCLDEALNACKGQEFTIKPCSCVLFVQDLKWAFR
jgi:hypothetical protein